MTRAHISRGFGRRSWCVVALLLLAAPLAAQQNPVRWTANAPDRSAAAGANVTVRLMAAIASGWHIYAPTQGPGGPMPTRVTVPDKQPFALGGEIDAPTPITGIDQNGVAIEFYQEHVSFGVPLTIEKTLKPGKHTGTVAVRYQTCCEAFCLPPQTVQLHVPVTVSTPRKG